MPIVSIIVPVYKVEKYIERCIDSILSQSFEDWELILVDDGSPDNSGKICDERSRNDSRIRVIHKKNGGVCSARNIGMEVSSGEWITFVDSDDFLSGSYLENLMSPLRSDPSIEFVYSTGRYFRDGRLGRVIQKLRNCTNSDLTYILDNFEGFIWGKLFKRELLEKGFYNRPVRFNSKFRICEDWAFSMEYLLSVRKYAVCSYVGYLYNRDNLECITKSTTLSMEEQLSIFKVEYDLLTACIKAHDILESNISNSMRKLATELYYNLLLPLCIVKEPLSKKENVLHSEIGYESIHILKYMRALLRYSPVQQMFMNGEFHITPFICFCARMESLMHKLYFALKFVQFKLDGFTHFGTVS